MSTTLPDAMILAAMKAAREAPAGDAAQYNAAIRFVRDQVEGDGREYKLALKAMMAGFRLGLSQMLEIEEAAINRYSDNGTFTKEIAARFAPAKESK